MNENRPVLKIPYSKFEKFIEVLALCEVFINIFIIIIYWAVIPNKIPTHFGFSGKIDAWGSKSTLLILPIVVIILYLFLTLLSHFPQVFNYAVPITEENARSQYHNSRKLINYLKTELLFIFSVLQYQLIMVALNKQSGFHIAFLPISLIIVFGTVGYFVYRSMKLI